MENSRAFNKRGMPSSHDPHPAKRLRTGPLSSGSTSTSMPIPEHAVMIESFVASMTRDLKDAVRRAYDEDKRVMENTLRTAEEKADCSRFCERVQAALDHAINSLGTTLARDLVPETPRYPDWYRSWLYQRPRLLTWTAERHSSPGAILASIENTRAPVGPMSVDNRISIWGLDVRCPPALPNPNNQVQKYAKAIRKTLGETIVRDFHAAAAEARTRGIRFEECKHGGKPPAEVVKEKFDCLNRLVTEFENAWAGQKQYPTPEEVKVWLNKRRHVVAFPQVVPVATIELTDFEDNNGDVLMLDQPSQRVTEREWNRDEHNEPCHCSLLDTKRKRLPCRLCSCSTRGFPCSMADCGCFDIEVCGNPFNNIERIIGHADSPLPLHECFITWLGERPYTSKPQPQNVDMEWLFDKIYFELGWEVVENDQTLREWDERWGLLKEQTGAEAEKQQHMQRLVHMAIAREYPGRKYFFSFCRRPKRDQLGGWIKEDEWQHCGSCKGCITKDAWHCGKCNHCLVTRAAPCFECGGVSKALRSPRKATRMQ